MSATRKMNPEEFLRLFTQIIQKFNEFTDSISTFKPIYQEEIKRRPVSFNLQSMQDMGLRFQFVRRDQINWAISEINEYRKSFTDWVDNDSHDYCENVSTALLKLQELNYLYQPNENCSKPCALLHHRIWFGSMLPKKYQQFIRNFMQYNPYYRLTLWIDSTLLSQEANLEIKNFCKMNGICLEEIRAHTDFLNFDLIVRELDESIADTNQCVHYARASDLARISILYRYGGMYTDTDTNTNGEIREISLPLGVAISAIYDGQFVTNNVIHSYQLGYDLVLGAAGNEVLKLAAEISHFDYRTYSHSSHQLWYQSKQSGVHSAVTMNLTGTALHHALQCYLPTVDITEDELMSLFVSQYHMPSSYDKSWLNSLHNSLATLIATDPTQLKAEIVDANLFIDEIKQSRLEKFPIPKGYYVYSLFRDFTAATYLSKKEHQSESKNANDESLVTNATTSRYNCVLL